MPPKPVPPLPSKPLPTPALSDDNLRLTYTYTPNEAQVLSLEPYKSLLLPYWRFVNPDLAHPSSSILYQIFESYVQRGDFVGADMARKYIQMGMTRAKRYANHKGGRKYDRTGLAKGELGELARDRKGLDKVKILEKWAPEEGGKDWERKREKEQVSAIFREVWERCRGHEGYNSLRSEWEQEKREWEMKGCPKSRSEDMNVDTDAAAGSGGQQGPKEMKSSRRRRGK